MARAPDCVTDQIPCLIKILSMEGKSQLGHDKDVEQIGLVKQLRPFIFGCR